MTSVDSGVAQSPRKWLYRVVTLLLLLVPAGLAALFFRELWWNVRVAVLVFLGVAWEPDLYTTVDGGVYPNLMSVKKKELDK